MNLEINERMPESKRIPHLWEDRWVDRRLIKVDIDIVDQEL